MSLPRPEVSTPPIRADHPPRPVRRIRHQARDAATSAAISLGGSIAVTLLAWAVITWLS